MNKSVDALGELNLTPITIHVMSASKDEIGNMDIRGYYLDSNIAHIKAKKAGAWDADGKVESRELHQDAEGNLYEVKPLGKPTDVSEKIKAEITASIKAKLSPQEWQYVHENRIADLK